MEIIIVEIDSLRQDSIYFPFKGINLFKYNSFFTEIIKNKFLSYLVSGFSLERLPEPRLQNNPSLCCEFRELIHSNEIEHSETVIQ